MISLSSFKKKIKIMEKIKILLVDDDPDFSDQMLFYLNKFGYNTIYLPSQRSAESRLKDLKFDLAIIDLMMEEEDSGLQLARKIKSNYPDIPIILLTAITNETGYSLSNEFDNSPELMPINKYCEKGIRPEVLNKIIQQLLTNKK